MADTIKIEDIEERVVLVGVSEQDGDDADDSLSELAELVKTAGATVVGTLIQRREKIHHTTTSDGKNDVSIVEYDITGWATDFNNWHKTGAIWDAQQ